MIRNIALSSSSTNGERGIRRIPAFRGYLFGLSRRAAGRADFGTHAGYVHRHADKVVMGQRRATHQHNPLALCSCLRNKFVATPNFHVFRDVCGAPERPVSSHHIFGAKAQLQTDGPNNPGAGCAGSIAGRSLWGLQGSPPVNGKQWTLTSVNPHATEARETEIVVRGGGRPIGQSTTLSSTDIHAHNSFENPHGLEPRKRGDESGQRARTYL